jgi:hypothetical protein
MMVVEFIDGFAIEIESSQSPLMDKPAKADARLLAGRKEPEVGMPACERTHSSASSDNTRSIDDDGC